MKTFYVSLHSDLIGCYLQFEADTRNAVNFYLANKYNQNGTWRMPWCSIYETVPDCDKNIAVLIKAKCGSLYEDQEYREYKFKNAPEEKFQDENEDEPDSELVRDDGQFGMGA